MKVVLIFSFCLITGAGASSKVTAHSGGGIFISCKYDSQFIGNTKYFCSGTCLTTIADQIKIADKNKWVSNGRFSLYDKTSASEFYVMIRELTVKDSGIYKCGVDVALQHDIYTQVELEVKEDACCEKSISKTGYLGGDLNISCNYPSSYRGHPKFLCRKFGNDGCNYKTAFKESQQWINVGKMSLFDDRENNVFIVTFIDLTEQDSGEYWCAAEINWDSDRGYKVFITQIHLRVTVPTTSLHVENFTPSSTTAAPETGFPTSTVIIVVCVILVLILSGIFILTRGRRKKTQGVTTTSESSLKDSGKNHNIPLTVSDYKDTEVSNQKTVPVSETNKVSFSSQAPSNSSNDDTNMSPHSPALYANMQIPLNPPYHKISSPKSPRNLPESSGRRTGQIDKMHTEITNYTTVAFPTFGGSSSNADNKIILKEEEDNSCDYATVNYDT